MRWSASTWRLRKQRWRTSVRVEFYSLALDSLRWSELEHAYGRASNIPDLLRQLSQMPGADMQSDPWLTLWSSLAHQDGIYSASFAVVPHVIAAISLAPEQADYGYFEFPAVIETCRIKSGLQIPADLSFAYFESLKAIPRLVALASVQDWDETDVRCALSAIAASKGQHALAEVLMEMSANDAKEYMRRAEME